MFFNEPETPDVDCDAPSYPIVRACRGLGFNCPEDVRWCHMTPAPPPRRHTSEGVFNFQAWKAFFTKAEPKGPSCFCGTPMPRLESYTFTLLSGKEMRYLLGQCTNCRTIYWNEA
jgi:hypothetical protein